MLWPLSTMVNARDGGTPALNSAPNLPISWSTHNPRGSEGPMSYDSNNRWSANANTAIPQVGIDVGLRSYMQRVYNYMAGGLAITGVVAYLAAASGFYVQIAHTPFI